MSLAELIKFAKDHDLMPMYCNKEQVGWLMAQVNKHAGIAQLTIMDYKGYLVWLQ